MSSSSDNSDSSGVASNSITVDSPAAGFDRDLPRFQVCVQEDLGQQVQSYLSFRPNRSEAFRVPCNLTDLHASGCAIKYQLPKPLPPSKVLLEIQGMSTNGTVRLLSGVCWTQQTGIDAFTSGLRFLEPLQPEVLNEGIENGIISRRTTVRIDVDVPVSVRQSQPPLACRCEVTSTSVSGMQIRGPEQATAGARMILKLDDSTTALATVAWSVARDDQFATGVAFEDLVTGHRFHDRVLQIDRQQS